MNWGVGKSGKKDVMIDTRMTQNTGRGKNKKAENGTKLILGIMTSTIRNDSSNPKPIF